MNGRASQVSVVVLSYNTSDLLDHCLRAVEAQEATCAIEVVVVDNASADNSVAMVRERHPAAAIIRNSTNRFFAAAANQGAAAATGDYLLFLNSDIQLRRGALNQLLRAPNDGCRVVIPILVDSDGYVQREYLFRPALSLHGIIAILMFRSSLQRRFGGAQPSATSGHVATDGCIDVVEPSAACVLIESDLFWSVGGFDEELALWFNDVDLFKRIRAGGNRIHLRRDASAEHIGGASVATMSESERAIRLYTDVIAYTRKWHPRAVVVVKIAAGANLLLRSLAQLRRPARLLGWMRTLPSLISPIVH